MKIKKSELLALIKEEIMSEMDEPRNDEDTMQEARLQEGVGMPEIMTFVNAIKFASDPVTAPLVAAVVAGTPLMLAFEQYSEMKKKKEGGK